MRRLSATPQRPQSLSHLRDSSRRSCDLAALVRHRIFTPQKNLPLCRKQASNSADVNSFYFSEVRAVAKYAPVWRFGLRTLQSSEGESALCHLCRGSVGVWTKAFYWETCRCRGSDVYTCPKSPPASSGAPCGRHPTGHKTSVPGFRGVCLAFQPH